MADQEDRASDINTLLANESGQTIYKFDSNGLPVFYNPADGQYQTNTGEESGKFTGRTQPGDPNSADEYFSQPGKRPLDRFTNIYDTNYKTGAQVSVFIGPIWLEECTHIQWTTSSNATPVHGYASRFYNTILQGNHQIVGQMAIAFKETDYLYRTIKEFEKINLKDTNIRTISDVISRGRSRFLNTLLSYRARQAVNGIPNLEDQGPTSRSIEDITRYVDYVINRRILDIEHNHGLFDIAIIYGNYKEGDFALRSFVDCHIVGTGQSIQQDDGVIIEVYNWIGRNQQLPERKKTIVKIDGTEIPLDPIVALSEAEKGLRELAKSLDVWPSIESNAIDRSLPGVLDSTDHIAMIGLPNEGTGIYGHEVKIVEPWWQVYYDKLIPLPERVERQNNVNEDALNLFDEEKVIRDKTGRAVLINDGLLWAKASENQPFINAITNVYSSARNIGSGIPPFKVPLASFRWWELDNKRITANTLWTSLISSEEGNWIKTTRT